MAAGDVRADEVRAMLGTIERGQVLRCSMRCRPATAQALMAEIDRLAEFSPDFAGVLDEIAGALHRVQLQQLVADYASAEEVGDTGVAALAGALSPEEVQLYYQIAIVGRRDLPLAPTARAGFEMTLLRMLAFRPGAPDARASALPARRRRPQSALLPRRLPRHRAADASGCRQATGLNRPSPPAWPSRSQPKNPPRPMDRLSTDAV